MNVSARDTLNLNTQDHAAHARFAHPEKNISQFAIVPGMRVADFGSGSGEYAFPIAKALVGSGHVFAIDIQKGLLRKLKTEAQAQKLENVEIVWADLEKHGASKIAEHSVDLVLISNLLFQLEDKRTPLREAARILKASGKLAIIDWAASFRGMGPIEKQVVKKDDALALAKSAGFALEREFPAGHHHYGLLFRKS